MACLNFKLRTLERTAELHFSEICELRYSVCKSFLFAASKSKPGKRCRSTTARGLAAWTTQANFERLTPATATTTDRSNDTRSSIGHAFATILGDLLKSKKMRLKKVEGQESHDCNQDKHADNVENAVSNWVGG